MFARRVAVAALSVSVLWTVSGSAGTTVPQLLTEQGRLTDTSGAPVTTSTMLTFSIYSASTGGTALWTEKQTLTPDAGYFSAELGSVTAFPTTLFTGAELYLGVTVGSDPELSPRQSVTSVPYALVAQNAIGDITPNSITVNGTEVINSSGAWVGSGGVGVVEVLENEAVNDAPAAIAGNTFAFACKTAAFVAGTGQTAIIYSEASALGVPATDGLGVRAAYNTGTDTTIGFWHYATSSGVAAANLKNSKVSLLPLTSGTSYVFETAYNNSDNTNTYTPTGVYCNTYVQIVTGTVSGGPYVGP
jgi:hypothetical protein